MGVKEEILAFDDRKAEEVQVPEWGGKVVRIAAMTAADRDDWELEAYGDRKAGKIAKNVRARLVARCVVDEAGQRVFSDEDIAALGAKSAKALDRLFDVAQRLNALSEKELQAVEGN